MIASLWLISMVILGRYLVVCVFERVVRKNLKQGSVQYSQHEIESVYMGSIDTLLEPAATESYDQWKK